MGRVKLITALIIMLVITAAPLSSCGASVNSQAQWQEANGLFYTDDIRMAQDKIPFEIDLPQYLPEGMGQDYRFQISGPLDSENLTAVEVEIEYSNGDKEIDISEINKEQEISQNQELDPVVLEISVGQVLRENVQIVTDSETLEGYKYRWNQGGFSFSVRVFSFNNDEGVKIVESMAEQLIP